MPNFHDVGQIIGLLRAALKNKMRVSKLPAKQQKPIEWTGPTFSQLGITKDNSHPVSSTLSDEGLAYHAERDLDPLGVIIMLAFQFGIENGIAMEKDVIQWLERDNARFRKELGKPSLDELTVDDIDFSFLNAEKKEKAP